MFTKIITLYSETSLIQHALEDKLCVGIDRVLSSQCKTHIKSSKWVWKSMCWITQGNRLLRCQITQALLYIYAITMDHHLLTEAPLSA